MNKIWIPDFNFWKGFFCWKSNVHEWVCVLGSLYLWHSDITSKAARHCLIWAKLTQLCILISLHSGLALYDALPIYGNHLPRAMRSLLKEQTFFGRIRDFHEEPRMPSVWSGHNGRAAAFGAGDSGGHILGSFRSYFIHNGRAGGRKFSRASKYLENLLFIGAGKKPPGKIRWIWGLRNPLSFLPPAKTKMPTCSKICPFLSF